MEKGSNLLKVRGKSAKYRRLYSLDPDHLAFRYKSKKCFSDENNKVLIRDIQEIRDGPISDVFVKAFKHLHNVKEDRCFSVVIGDKHKTLDLVAQDRDTKCTWVTGLKHLQKKLLAADLSTKHEMWIKSLFKTADKNGDNVLSLKEIVGLLKHVNIECDFDTAKQMFQEADTNKSQKKKGEDSLDLDEFLHFYKLMTHREELQQLFDKYSYEDKYLEPYELQEFFQKEEDQRLSLDECSKFISEFEPCPTVRGCHKMSIDGFQCMFNSNVLNVLDPQQSHVHQDMTHPLSDYFIDSSHNTYLTSDQLMGPSAVESYIRTLKSGCRCVELDCWDGDSGEPVIYHGHTFTSKILFKDVIVAISMYGFIASEYPVILSIENHCSIPQQRLMAKHLHEILGDLLYSNPMATLTDKLPSPDMLKKKVIIKGKKLATDVVDGDEGDVSDEDEAADLEDEQIKQEVSRKSRKKHQRLAKELSDCVTICQSVSFKDFKHSKKSYNFKQMSSYGESKAMDLAADKGHLWVKQNQWQLSRIYPAGRRTDSSNYNPLPVWKCGCQIVAMNQQTPDDDLLIYKGMFVDNGGCGYILKPPFLLDADQNFNPAGPYPSEWKKHLTVRVVSGYQLPKKKGDKNKSILDPYVKVEVRGVNSDTKIEKTSHIHNNGFHPVWDTPLEFDIQVPDLAIVSFRVMDYENITSNVLIAQNCLRFSSLQPGYRTVPLKSKCDAAT
ncbi:1-phosphatidylinositol 4,5-bisphosphate phosphodiesterase delta-1 [Lamellibrachia satsuma]|nr:1-phosphatidylinositol 4,5-bisphosphate phosphodiesterase delta-1 [Lamellibrachia satsuma]